MEFEGRSKISLNLNLAPLIDVVLLLLIFFMLTSSYIVAEAIDLELPKSDTARPVDEADIVVTLHEDGSILVSGQPVSRDALKKFLETAITNPETANHYVENGVGGIRAGHDRLDGSHSVGGRAQGSDCDAGAEDPGRGLDAASTANARAVPRCLGTRARGVFVAYRRRRTGGHAREHRTGNNPVGARP